MAAAAAATAESAAATATGEVASDVESFYRWIANVVSGREVPIVLLNDHPQTLRPCRSFIRDVARTLLIVTFAMQVVLFQGYYQSAEENAARHWSTRQFFWALPDALTLMVFLIMLLAPRIYLPLYLVLFEYIWHCAPVHLFTPLGDNGTRQWYGATGGASYVPQYAGWVIYVLASLVPRLGWMLFFTTPNSFGSIIPEGYLVFTFIMDVSMHLGYLYDIGDTTRGDPFEVIYVLLNATKKSVLEILDLEAIMNSMGSLQGTMGNETYFLWSFLVMGAVTVHLVLTTLEVYYRRRGLWNLTSLRTLVTSTDAEQNRYGRCSTLFLVVYLLLSLVADMVIFSVRLLIAFDMNGIISPFIYKNLYYIIVNLCYMHSLFVLLVQAEELKAGWIA
eukprot:scpid83195/ scgid21355/ 